MSKHKKVKARKGWAMNVKVLPSRAYVFHKKAGVFNAPVFVLPADADSYDAMVEQMTTQRWQTAGIPFPDYFPPNVAENYRENTRKELAAIGLTRPATKEKSK